MPSWNEVLIELQRNGGAASLDIVRRKYLKAFSVLRGRNVIAYYSGWLQKPGASNLSINDGDKNGFMATVHKMNRSLGLDLILHTPGGDVAATDSIIDYLQQLFDGNVEVFVPQLAMSAGTMIACSSRKIYMGKESSIGPIDPQLRGVPCYGVLEEFRTAVEESRRNPAKLPFWREIVSKYDPTFIGECKKSIQLSAEIVRTRLETIMFAGRKNAKTLAGNVVKILSNHNSMKLHARHLNANFARKCGLVVENLEDDQALQDALLTVHHCYMHTFASSPACKIIENGEGTAIVYSG